MNNIMNHNNAIRLIYKTMLHTSILTIDHHFFIEQEADIANFITTIYDINYNVNHTYTRFKVGI